MNIGDPWPDLDEAELRVLEMQRKLHHWAKTDPGRRFDDLHNLVYDPCFLVVAWERVRGNKGARTAGIDGIAPRSVGLGAGELLSGLRAQLKAGQFVPQRVREKAIPKTSGKVRRLGIPTTADRVVQAALKLAGGAVMKLVRYADDFVVMLAGQRADADALWDEVGAVLAPVGLRLSVEKSRVCHIDEGFDFLGWHIQRRVWRGRTGKRAVYTYPSKKALASIVDKVRTLTRRAKHRTLADLLRRLNPVLRWCTYFHHGVSSRTFSYVDHFAFWRIIGWLRKRHVGLNMHTLVRRFLPGWRVRAGKIELFRPRAVAIVRYRYRGNKIPTPWSSPPRIATPVA